MRLPTLVMKSKRILFLPDMQKDAMTELDGLLAMDELEIKPTWE